MSHKATTWGWEVSAQVPSAPALLVLLKLCDMARDSGRAWPSHAYLAGKLPLSQRTIRSALVYLEEIGLLTKEPREGKSDLLILNLSPVTIYPDGAEDDSEFEGGKPRGRPRKTSADSADTPDKTSAAGAPKPKEPDRTSGLIDAPDPFELWWKVYPRKQAKAEGRKAFWKAAAKLPFADLMTKTRAFADHVVGKDPELIPHPATWLNGERWTDELPSRSQTDGHHRTSTGAADRVAQRERTVLDPMLTGAQAALDRRRRWTLGG